MKSKELSRLSPASYRPIALLPVLSKIVERTVQTQLQDYLEKNALLNSNGHAYRKDLSTSTAIMQLTERLYEATDSNLISQMLALDQSAAFDCVSHPILVQKLRLYGCDEDTITWMQSYLGHRTQYTTIGRHKSNMVAVDRGVPQGSILGPLLYLLFTNEITEVIKDQNCPDTSHSNNTELFGQNCNQCGEIIIYADDITYLIANKHRASNQDKINVNLEKLNIFLNDNELKLNIGKTHLLELMIKQKRGRINGNPPQIEVTTDSGERKIIHDKKELRILGVNFQHNLGWKAHMETGLKATLPATRKTFGSIKQLGKMLPTDSKKLLAEGLLMSKIIYAISQWGGAGPTMLTTAQRLQNKIARWITGSSRRIRNSTLLETLGWFSIQETEKIHSLTQLWKILNKTKPANIWNKIETNTEMEIKTQPTRLQFTNNSFLKRTTLVWNTLPSETRKLKSLPTFKVHLKKWIKSKRNMNPD